jgi:hypothetical protein
MAEYLLRNSLNPGKVVSCSVSFRQIVNKGEEGEPVWLVEIRTLEPHKDGGSIPPEYIHYTNDQNLDVAIRKATQRIASKVNWEPTITDIRPPFVVDYSPRSDVVDIYSDVMVDITDILPAAGIDPDSITMTINGLDVTDEIELIGDPYNYRVMWQPKIRVLDYY